MLRRVEVVLVCRKCCLRRLELQQVEEIAVVGAPGTAEDHMPLVSVHVVGETDARLPGALAAASAVAIADVVVDVHPAQFQRLPIGLGAVAAWIDPVQRCQHRSRCHVIGVGGSLFIIPTHAKVQGQLVGDRPVILEIDAELLVLGCDRAIADARQRITEANRVRHVQFVVLEVVVELRVVRLLLGRTQIHHLVLEAHLEAVSLETVVAEVILQGPAFLALVLVVRASTDHKHGFPPVCIRQHHAVAAVGRARVVRRILERQVRIVQPVAVGVLVAQVDAGLVVVLAGRTGGGVDPDDVGDLGFIATFRTQLEVVVHADQPIDLAEVQALLERYAEGTDQIPVLCGNLVDVEAAPRDHRIRRRLILGFEREEEVRAILDDRPAEGHAVVLLGEIRLWRVVALLENGLGTPVAGELVPEHRAAELVAAGLGDGNDGSAADLVEFRLVVGGDDLVFTDRELRERVAVGRILAGNAALQHIVLLANAIDEDVDAVGGLGARTQAGAAIRSLDELHARDGIGEPEEVACALRQRLDLLGADVGGDFRRAGLRHRLADDLYRIEVGHAIGWRRRGGQVDGGDLRNLQGDGARATGAALDAIGTGRQARQCITATGGGVRAARVAGIDIGHRDLAAGTDLAAQRRARRLRHERRGHDEAGGQRAAQQAAVVAFRGVLVHGIPSRETFVSYGGGSGGIAGSRRRWIRNCRVMHARQRWSRARPVAAHAARRRPARHRRSPAAGASHPRRARRCRPASW